MNHKKLLLSILLACLAVPSVSFAQEKLNRHFGLSQLLGIGGVARDLEMTSAQIDSLSTLWWETSQALKRTAKTYNDNYIPKLSQDEKDDLKSEFEESVLEIQEKELERLEKVLLPKQIKRLRQIRFQYMKRDTTGLEAMRDDLNLQDDQIDEFKKVSTEFNKLIRELQNDLRLKEITRAEYDGILAEEKQKLKKDLLDVLTSSQKRILKDLEGEHFEFNSKIRQQMAEEKAEKEGKSKKK